LKAGAEAAFRAMALAEKENAMADYRAKQQAELDKTVRLRALRLARETENAQRDKTGKR
jgi:hypothetical protein